MDMPLSVLDTGKKIMGIKTYTDILIPNCPCCFVMSGAHEKTKERGYFAFCKKSGKLEKVGPYGSYNESLKYLVMTHGCDSCDLNKSNVKEAYLPILDENIKAEIKSIYGIGQTTALIMSPLQDFVESRNFLDANFETRFGVRLFISLTDDAVAINDLVKPCVNQRDFALKIQALSGLIDRINEKELKKLIRDQKERNGSINVLEQFLKENFPNYPKYIISNFRHLLAVRSKMYPAHATASEIVIVLGNFGLKYPMTDWEEGVSKILRLCANSLSALLTLVQNE